MQADNEMDEIELRTPVEWTFTEEAEYSRISREIRASAFGRYRDMEEQPTGDAPPLARTERTVEPLCYFPKTIGNIPGAAEAGRRGAAATKRANRGRVALRVEAQPRAQPTPQPAPLPRPRRKTDGRTGKYQPRTFSLTAQDCLKYFAEGLNGADIARKEGCSVDLVWKLLRVANIKRPSRPCMDCKQPTGKQPSARRCDECKRKFKCQRTAEWDSRKRRAAERAGEPVAC